MTSLPAYERVIKNHPLCNMRHPNYAVTIGDLARYIIKDAAAAVMATKVHQNRPIEEVVLVERIPLFMDNLAKEYCWSNQVPVIGRIQSIEVSGKIRLNNSIVSLSGHYHGIHECDLPDDNFTIPYILERIKHIQEALGCFISPPDLKFKEKGLSATFSPGERPSIKAEINLHCKPHGSDREMSHAVEHIAAEMMMRSVQAKLLKSGIKNLKERAQEAMGSHGKVTDVRIVATHANMHDYQHRPTLGSISYEIKIEALNEFLLPEITEHHTKGFVQEMAPLPGSIKNLRTRMNARATRTELMIDGVYAANLARRSDAALSLLENMRSVATGGEPDDADTGDYLTIKDGIVCGNLTLNDKPRVHYRSGELTIWNTDYPATIKTSLKGQDATKLIDCPDLAGCKIQSFRMKEGNLLVKLKVSPISLDDFEKLIGIFFKAKSSDDMEITGGMPK